MRNLMLIMLLSGCAAQTPIYVTVCPVAPKYSKSFEQSAAAQLKTLPDNSPIVKMISDYIALRAETKACNNP